MKDQLEEYIKQHRNELDTEVPGPNTWEKIERRLNDDPQKKMIDYSIIWKVAAIFFFAVSGYLFIQSNNNSSIPFEDASTGILKEFEETEAYYTMVINEKKAVFKQYDAIAPQLINSFKLDIANLDSMYLEQKKELHENSNEMILSALIQNLQVRIEILNKQLEILEEVQKIEKDVPASTEYNI